MQKNENLTVFEAVAADAVSYADALLEELEKTEKKIMKKQYNERPTTIIVWLVVILAIIVMIAFTGIKPAM